MSLFLRSTGYRLRGPHETERPQPQSSAGPAGADGEAAAEAAPSEPEMLSPGHRINEVRFCMPWLSLPCYSLHVLLCCLVQRLSFCRRS